MVWEAARLEGGEGGDQRELAERVEGVWCAQRVLHRGM